MTLTLVVFAGYWFGAAGLFGQTPYTRTSPQTLTCMVLLAFVAIGRRADHGFFSVLIGIGIGSRIARIVLPFCLLLPFALAAVGSGVTALGWLSTTYAAALTATISSVAFSGLVLLMAWRINGLEHDLREMSLTDPLTGVYNRRGFDLLGEQALRDARRSSTPLTVLFFDVDELKSVNDRFGHEVGSQFLQDMARLLRQTFREADIVARIGGDEFAVIMHGEAANAVARVDAAAILLNREHGRRFPIGYSVGVATAAPDDEGSLDRLAGRADAMMYEQKRAKKSARAVG
jgi:diguanylate cyclase (GGDEF)-like protein